MENKIKELEKELKFLTNEAIKEEVEKNKHVLETKAVNIKDLAEKIYISRGLNIKKINNGLITNIISEINIFCNSFKSKDKTVKRKMIIDIVYFVLLIILLKIPFDLVRDIGFEYVELLSSNNIFYTLWNLLFLIIYTITILCTLVVLFRNFNNKYEK